MTHPSTHVIGAGPAGLMAALTLARAGRSVRVLERTPVVGHRFADDLQGLENWSREGDVLDDLARLGVTATFDHRPVHEVTFYDPALRPAVVRCSAPLFYLVRRGPTAGTFDRALLDQARDAGAWVLLSTPAERAHRGDIVAIGPRYADGIVGGYVFRTRLPDQAHCIISDDLAPGGYAYLLVWSGRATLATCLFRDQRRLREARRRTVETFLRIVPGLELDDARRFAGYGSVFGRARFLDEAGRLFVGEAAGLQDPEWGFGMRYAVESGELAARALVEGFDYAAAARRRFEGRRAAGFANRLVYEHLPAGSVAWLLRRATGSVDLRRRLRRHWAPDPVKSLIARLALPAFGRRRLRYRDLACHRSSCDCVWCTHGSPQRPGRRSCAAHPHEVALD